MSIFDKFQHIRETRERLAALGLTPFGAETTEIYSATEGLIEGRRTILAGTNNYLGMTFQPRCIQAAREALAEQGTGTTGSRMASGTYGGHAALEREFAAFYGEPACIVFTTGYQANLGILSTLAGRGDVLLIDADSHASIYDGARMSEAEVIRFRHNDPMDLDKRLRRLGERAKNALIVVEGIYSMLGDTAPLAEIVQVKNRHGAYLLVDEAHSLGILGERGRGLVEQAGVQDQVDFIVGTFSKSLGSIGGFCVSRHPELELVRFASRAYVFTASGTPAIIAGAREALRILAGGQELRAQLRDNGRRLHGGLRELGFRLGCAEPGPVVAVVMDSPEQAIEHWGRLLAAGVYVNLVLPPGAPDGHSLLRVSLSAAHTMAQVEAILGAFASLRVSEPAPAD